MKLKLQFLFCILILSFAVNAQWVQQAGFPGSQRAKSTAFTINGRIYILGGVDNSANVLRDFWEYDISTNTWSQKPDFPGPERYGATSFVLNNYGYIATGGNDNGYLDDLWRYDPVADSWLQRTGLPAFSAQHENQRREAYSFTIGNKAYLGGGDGFVFSANSTNNIAFYDLWEYDPIVNGWTQKSDEPDFIGRDFSIGISINGKGYVGLGCDVNQTINRQGFWEYDPATDTWTSKTDFPSVFTTDAGAFVLDSSIYITGGVRLGSVALSNQFYKYEPATDTWTALSAFNGGAIAGHFAISTGAEAFVGTGYNGSLVARNDLWEFTDAALGINENGLLPGNMTGIYPNPARENIVVYSPYELSSVEIYDVTGNIVLNEKNNLKTINISSFTNGIYNVKLIFKNGSFTNRRFLKID